MNQGQNDGYIYVDTPERIRRKEVDIFRRHPVSSHLLKQVDRLGGSYRVERSFKLVQNRMLRNRFIVTVPLNGPSKESPDAVLEICRALQMVEEHHALCAAHLEQAGKIHFGFEEDGDRSLLKVYLEFPYNLKVARDGPWQLLLGFKWDPEDHRRCAISRYVGLPTLTPRDMHKRIAAFFTDPRFRDIRDMVTAVLVACDRRVPQFRSWYLDVTEEENPRRSFDIKTYRSRLKIRDIASVLKHLLTYFDIRLEEQASYFSSIEDHKFGHLSCGIGRSGDFFVAIYHEAEGQ